MNIKDWDNLIVPILVSLSNRINSDKEFWIGMGESGETYCHICHNYIDRESNSIKESFNMLQEHGINHLKEHNLLPFI